MKFNLPYYLILWLFVMSGLSSCKDIFEPNIKDREVRLQAPGNQLHTTLYSVNFWWDEVEDALSYRLQVVSPKFDSVGSLVLDTLVKSTRFTINLSPGNYEWHVRAENGSSRTAYSTSRVFTIQPSSIKDQKVQLSKPANNLLTNQSNVAFSWGDLFGATKYRLEIDTNNFVDETKLLYNQVTPALQVNFNLQQDQIYQWRVRAENDTAQAQWSVINQFTYDHTPPPKVVVSLPADKQTLTSPVTLQWNNAATAVKYKLYVLKSDSTTSYNASFPLTQTGTSFLFTPGAHGEQVYWKVSAIDAAGNEGQSSTVRSFVLQ